MKILLRVVSGLLLVAVIAYFVLYTIRTLKNQDFSTLFSVTSLSAIFFAACLYALIIPFSAWAWQILLTKRDERWSVKLLAAIMGTTQLAKYIPGNIAQHLGRAALSMRYGMTMKTYMVTVVQETLLAVGASLFIGMCFLQMSPLAYDRLPERYQMLLLISSLVFVLLVLVLFMGYVKAPAWLTRNTAGTRLNELWGTAIGAKATLQVFCLYACNYLVIGLGMWLVAEALHVQQGGYALFTASFALAWVLGFLAPGAPAGMGVREGMLVLFLSGILDDTKVLSLVLAMRLVTIAGDVLCWLVGLLGLFREKSCE